jgi:hypothetical protein
MFALPEGVQTRVIASTVYEKLFLQIHPTEMEQLNNIKIHKESGVKLEAVGLALPARGVGC